MNSSPNAARQPAEQNQLIGAGVSTRHLNQRELAERLNISPRTLERWRWIGEGPPFLKIGGRCVYRLQDIERYEAKQLRESTTTLPSIQPT
jgi:DNA-binding transcriptional MerR regulator